MFGLQNTLIAIGISLLVGLGIGGYTAYSFTADHYQAQITKERDAAKSTLIAKQDELIKQERTNNEIQNNLDKLAAEYATKRTADAATIRKLLASRDSWVHSPVVCEASSAGASDSPSGEPQGEATNGTLSPEFQEWLVEKLEQADALRDYANVCEGYVKEIEVQRERLKNE